MKIESPELVKHFVQDLGFTYLSATNKEEYLPRRKNSPVLKSAKSQLYLKSSQTMRMKIMHSH